VLWNGNEYGKARVIKTSRDAYTSLVKTEQKQLENVECFNYLRNLITNEGRYTRDFIFTIAVIEAAFIRKTTFHQQTGLKFQEETSEVLC
jgi:hypothetical protein